MNNLEKTFQWILRNPSDPLLVLISVFFPSIFLRKFYTSAKKINWRGKKSCLTLSFDCDSTEDIEQLPEILTLLSALSIKASFACIGKFIEQYPDIHKYILSEGHEIINHTYSHPNNPELNPFLYFNKLSTVEMAEEIKKCHDTCKNLLDYSPIGFRSPHFKRLYTRKIYGILSNLGYKYSSSTIAIRTPNYGMPFITKEGIIEFPLSNCPRHLFTVLDTSHSFRSKVWIYKFIKVGKEEFIRSFERLLRIGIATGAYLNVYFDPRDFKNLGDSHLFFRNLFNEFHEDLLILPYNQLVESEGSFFENLDH